MSWHQQSSLFGMWRMRNYKAKILKEKTFNLNKLLQSFGKFWFDLLELVTQEWKSEKEQVMCFSNCIKLDKLQPILHE